MNSMNEAEKQELLGRIQAIEEARDESINFMYLLSSSLAELKTHSERLRFSIESVEGDIFELKKRIEEIGK